MTNPGRTPQSGREYPPPDEAESIEAILQFQLQLMKQLGPRVRGQHPKGHGCVRAEFAVLDNLSDELRFGVFREPQTYPALIRFSNGFVNDDRLPDFHGMAIKLLGVPGVKLLDSGTPVQTQDFILADTPVFFAADVKRLLTFMQEKMRLAESGLSPEDQMQQLAKSCPNEVELFTRYARRPEANPLAAQYWSCVPYKLGEGAVKYHSRPAPTNVGANVGESTEDFLRQAMVNYLTAESLPAHFDFFVQRQTNATTMPIEDATVEWDSPFERVATITIPPQRFDAAPQLAYCENLSFNPWHALPDHRPLGGLNRSRRVVYRASSRLRHETNDAVMEEPASIEEFPE